MLERHSAPTLLSGRREHAYHHPDPSACAPSVPQDSLSGNIHGMVLSFLMGLGNARKVRGSMTDHFTASGISSLVSTAFAVK